MITNQKCGLFISSLNIMEYFILPYYKLGHCEIKRTVESENDVGSKKFTSSKQTNIITKDLF